MKKNSSKIRRTFYKLVINAICEDKEIFCECFNNEFISKENEDKKKKL